MNDDAKPPLSGARLVAVLVHDVHLRDGVIGDLTEDYRLITSQSSLRAAKIWYWSQIVRSALPLAFLSIVGTGWRGWMRLAWAVLAGYATLAVMVVTTDGLLGRLVQAGDWRMPAGSLALGVVGAIVAGYVAASVGRRAPLAPALILGAAAVLLSATSLATGGDGTPRWYQIGLMLIVLPSVLAGACGRAWRLRRRNRRFKDGD